jgi:RNA polymerase sigma-70 factor (ECF subfamily)
MNELAGEEQDARDMARLVEGDDDALNDLMERHAEKLFHYLMRSLQDEADAADLAQETFAKVYLSRTKFDPNQKFATWLYAIASNLVRDRYRWRSRHPQVSLDADNEQTEANFKDNLPAADRGPDQEELRQPLILAIYQGLSQAEIASILKCSVKAVETRIYRARQQLRAGLAELVQTL